MIAVLLAAATAASDCEAPAGGAVAQPANAWSSLAFALAGAWILGRALRGTHGRTPELAVFAAAVAANAVGSFAYHATASSWGHWAHDMSIYAVLAFVAIHDVGTLRAWNRRAMLVRYAVCLAVLGAVRALAPATTDALAALVAVGAASGEALAFRAGLRPRPRDGFTLHLAAWLLAIGAGIAGSVSFLLGSSASPLCNPTSRFQWHAAWHVLQAVAMVAYAYAAVELWSPADVPAGFRARLHGSPTDAG